MKCPICKQHRNSKLHGDWCSKVAQQNLRADSSFIGAYKSKIKFNEIPTTDKRRR